MLGSSVHGLAVHGCPVCMCVDEAIQVPFLCRSTGSDPLPRCTVFVGVGHAVEATLQGMDQGRHGTPWRTVFVGIDEAWETEPPQTCCLGMPGRAVLVGEGQASELSFAGCEEGGVCIPGST